jgi:predicted DNA-binding ribbon-helix-helix protein
LVARIDLERQHGNLSSAIRLYVFEQRCKHEQAAEPANDHQKEHQDESQPPRRHD